LQRKNYRFFMYQQMLVLIINKLQPFVDFAVRDQREIILKYRKHGALTEGCK